METKKAFPIMKVLIVEDQSIISFGYRLQLESMGFEVLGTPKSAIEAEKAIRAERPDMLLMDIRILGERSGLEMVEDLYENGDPIPAVFLTASIDPSIIERIEKLGSCHYLPKPVNSSKLRNVLKDLAA